MGDLTENFSRSEFACKCNYGCGYDGVKLSVVYGLQIIRDHFGKAITVTSGCRCGSHNKSIGGRSNSKHLFGIACDFVVEGVSPDEVADFIDDYFGGNNGVGMYRDFTHFDTRTDKRARWRAPGYF